MINGSLPSGENMGCVEKLVSFRRLPPLRRWPLCGLLPPEASATEPRSWRHCLRRGWMMGR